MNSDSPFISPSPQIHAPRTTQTLMAWVLIGLFPAAVWGGILFGGYAVLMLGVSAVSAVLTEWILNVLFKRKNTLNDLSALLTGVLIGFNMPPGVPLFVPVMASIFAIAVVKWCFGGLGSNWMNPALAGRVFVFFSWGNQMTQWMLPRLGGADAVSGPTPLGALKVNLLSIPPGIQGPMPLLESAGMPLKYMDLFLGKIPGSFGEVSAALLLAGGLLLLVLRIIRWETPVVYLGSFAFLMWMFGGLRYGTGLFSGDVLFHLFSGGLMLGAWFMATDPATTPLTRKGQVIFAIGCGFFTFVLRYFGSFPEGVSLAIIFMNILYPLIDRFTGPARYGHPK